LCWGWMIRRCLARASAACRRSRRRPWPPPPPDRNRLRRLAHRPSRPPLRPDMTHRWRRWDHLTSHLPPSRLAELRAHVWVRWTRYVRGVARKQKDSRKLIGVEGRSDGSGNSDKGNSKSQTFGVEEICFFFLSHSSRWRQL
jgi:hypothetical protein